MNSDRMAETQMTYLALCAPIFDTKVGNLFNKTKFVLILWQPH